MPLDIDTVPLEEEESLHDDPRYALDLWPPAGPGFSSFPWSADSLRPFTFAEARSLLLGWSPELEVQHARVDQNRALSRQALSTFLPRIGVPGGGCPGVGTGGKGGGLILAFPYLENVPGPPPMSRHRPASRTRSDRPWPYPSNPDT